MKQVTCKRCDVRFRTKITKRKGKEVHAKTCPVCLSKCKCGETLPINSRLKTCVNCMSFNLIKSSYWQWFRATALRHGFEECLSNCNHFEIYSLWKNAHRLKGWYSDGFEINSVLAIQIEHKHPIADGDQSSELSARNLMLLPTRINQAKSNRAYSGWGYPIKGKTHLPKTPSVLDKRLFELTNASDFQLVEKLRPKAEKELTVFAPQLTPTYQDVLTYESERHGWNLSEKQLTDTMQTFTIISQGGIMPLSNKLSFTYYDDEIRQSITIKIGKDEGYQNKMQLYTECHYLAIVDEFKRLSCKLLAGESDHVKTLVAKLLVKAGYNAGLYSPSSTKAVYSTTGELQRRARVEGFNGGGSDLAGNTIYRDYLVRQALIALGKDLTVKAWEYIHVEGCKCPKCITGK